MHNGDYPGQAFFGVFKGRKQRVESTYNQLLENIQDFPGAVYEAFMNRAHATQFSKTGKIPPGAVPVKPGASRTTISPGLSLSRTLSTPLSAAPKLELKNKSSSMSSAIEKSKLASAALGRGVKPVAAVASGSKSSSGSKSDKLGITAALNRTQHVHVWTDGSCLGNGRQGATAAYAVYFGPDDPRNEAKRAPGPQTNNTGEIFAVIRALEIVDESVQRMTIYTDSEYTIKCLEWLPGWKKRGGMNSSNKPATHYAIVKYMDALIKRRGNRLELIHVRAHQDNEGNNAADRMAREAAEEVNIPPVRDWEYEYAKLQKKPLVSAVGSPKIATVDSVQVKPEPDDESDYGYSDLEEYDAADVYDVDSPSAVNPSDTSLSDNKPAAGKKRSRDEPAEEVPDSDVERKVVKKKAKEQPVKCPNCKHKFSVTLK